MTFEMNDHFMIPRHIFCDDVSCSSLGTAAECLPKLQENDESNILPERWNCDLRVEVSELNTTCFPQQMRIDSYRENFYAPGSSTQVRCSDSFRPYDLEFNLWYDNLDPDMNESKACGNLPCVPGGFGTSRMSARSRIEMWQHQLSKPLKVLSLHRSGETRVGAMTKAMIEKVGNNKAIAALNCSKARKLLREEESENVQGERAIGLNEPPHKSDSRDGNIQKLLSTSNKESQGMPNCQGPMHPSASAASKNSIFRKDDSLWISQVPTDESSDEESAVILESDLG